jgi:hypothetical protein
MRGGSWAVVRYSSIVRSGTTRAASRPGDALGDYLLQYLGGELEHVRKLFLAQPRQHPPPALVIESGTEVVLDLLHLPAETLVWSGSEAPV